MYKNPLSHAIWAADITGPHEKRLGLLQVSSSSSIESLSETSVCEESVDQRILRSQFIKQRLGVLQISGIEAFRETVVDFLEHRASLIALALLVEQSRQADGRAQLK